MKRKGIVSRRTILFSFLLLLIMILCGSLWDYPISKALFNPSSLFGLFFAAFGEYPLALAFAVAGTLLIISRNKEKRVLSILQIILGVFFVFSSFSMATILPMLNLNLSLLPALLIGATSVVLIIFGTAYISKESDRRTAIRIALFIVSVVILDILIVNVVKVPWGRARMRLIAIDERAYFVPWWKPGTEMRDTLVAMGVNGEEFKSFPSGHTADASALLMLSILPFLSRKWEGKEDILFIIGIIWTIVVGFSRIVMGAHFLSDVTVGMTIGLLVFLLCSKVFLVRGKPVPSDHPMV